MSDHPKPTGEWTVEPVKKLDGTLWSEIAYVVEPNGRKHGSVNEQVAIGLANAIHAALDAEREKAEAQDWRHMEKAHKEVMLEREKGQTLVECLSHLIHSSHGFSPDGCHGCAQAQRLAKAKVGK